MTSVNRDFWRHAPPREKTAGTVGRAGEEAPDFPLYCRRLGFFPEVAEHETVADLFLPLKESNSRKSGNRFSVRNYEKTTG
ncbi:hypothetical protein [Rhizobium sp. GCM10022189]|uniref:hypothetical protein n=1 Tax=Rhizobium sp. GCM10022189 TaxID=3252654 RepID=UPI003605D272